MSENELSIESELCLIESDQVDSIAKLSALFFYMIMCKIYLQHICLLCATTPLAGIPTTAIFVSHNPEPGFYGK